MKLSTTTLLTASLLIPLASVLVATPLAAACNGYTIEAGSTFVCSSCLGINQCNSSACNNGVSFYEPGGAQGYWCVGTYSDGAHLCDGLYTSTWWDGTHCNDATAIQDFTGL